MKILRSVRVRLVLWMILLEFFLLLALSTIFLLSLQNTVKREIDEKLQLSASQLNAVLDVYGGKYQVPETDQITLEKQGVMAWVLSLSGDLVASVGEAQTFPMPETLPSTGNYLNGMLPNNEPVRIFISSLDEGQQQLGSVILAISLSDSQKTIRQMLFSLGIAIPVVLLLSASGGLFLANKALKPVSVITQTARHISAADLSQRINLTLSDDEIGQLAETFNEMLSRIELAFHRERQFTSDMSHELRTPLALLKTQLSLARSRPRGSVELVDMMSAMESDVDRMTHLVEQMLTLARLEQQGLEYQFIPVDINKLLSELCIEMQILAEEKHVELTLTTNESVPIFIQGNPPRLSQVFMNLIENGLKYTPSGGNVSVSLRQVKTRVEIEIADNGQGIPAEKLPFLFERFYRIDNSRARDTGGFGLGLAITKAIVQAHHGEIQVRSNLGEGTVFFVAFNLFM